MTNLAKHRGRAVLSWLFPCALLALCAVLGVLQYRWIDEVSAAARVRLHGSLQASLFRVASDFDSEIAAGTRALTVFDTESTLPAVETRLLSLYGTWSQVGQHRRMFRRIGLAARASRGLSLRLPDTDSGAMRDAEWPAEWSALEHRLDLFATRGPGMPRGMESNGGANTIFEMPLFAARSLQPSRGGGGGREIGWLIFELNPEYARDVMLPEILQRHLGTGGTLDYQVEVVTRSSPAIVIYRTDAGPAEDLMRHADASAGLFESGFDFRPRGMRGAAPGPGPSPGGPPPGSGRWQIFVRHRAGSLEALVLQARRRNLAVTAGVLLLMVATIAALVRLTRRSQALAAEQMGFVNAVSHELRTPLTVIYTAGYNLQGKIASNPAQVEKYGALIQRESGRLRELVEQVLRFGGAEAGRTIREPEPTPAETVIDDAVESTRVLLEGSPAVIQKRIEPELPLMMGDALALQHALQNLLSNAVKYASGGGSPIVVSAGTVVDRGRTMVEIRVADGGPGIPADEQKRIFDPFFRGARAIADQVHGTGLGLSLVKKIVEAHGGAIHVKSVPMHGAEFIVRIPAAPGGGPE